MAASVGTRGQIEDAVEMRIPKLTAPGFGQECHMGRIVPR